MTGDFNARSTSWWSGNVDNIESTHLESTTSFYRLHEIINELTHILASSPSCTDFRGQNNVWMSDVPPYQQNIQLVKLMKHQKHLDASNVLNNV